ncbi:transposable element Tcb2 transposase [Trichonephila clavipes]|nr:transposable element Tcb2 transposase [Trichonephila clavipes]
MSTMSQRSHLTDSEAWRVGGRLEGGQTQAQVAQAIGVSQSVISRIWNRFLETGSASRRSGQGRRRSVCSPTDDMNPIENVWDSLGRRVAGRQPPSQTIQELERALLEEWDRIPQLVINSLIDSMPQRMFGVPNHYYNDVTSDRNVEVPVWFGSGGVISYPSRSLLDFSAWDFVKDQMYTPSQYPHSFLN